MKNELSLYKTLAGFILPPKTLDFFDFVKADESPLPPGKWHTMRLDIYLDERDNRTPEAMHLVPNGFTEPLEVEDFPVREWELHRHYRRRRCKDKDDRNVLLYTKELAAEGTRYSKEFGVFFKDQDGYGAYYGPFFSEMLRSEW